MTVGLPVALVLLQGCSFLVSSTATPQAATEEVLSRGAQLYMENCQVCHGDRNGAGRQPYVPSHGPDGHTWHHSDTNLRDIILNGSGAMSEMMREMEGVPPDAPRMPAWKGKLSEEDVQAIIAHIKTFWTPEERRQQQETPMMR